MGARSGRTGGSVKTGNRHLPSKKAGRFVGGTTRRAPPLTFGVGLRVAYYRGHDECPVHLRPTPPVPELLARARPGPRRPGGAGHPSTLPLHHGGGTAPGLLRAAGHPAAPAPAAAGRARLGTGV